MVDPYIVVRDVVKELREAVTQFDKETVTTDNLDIWSIKKIVALYLYVRPYLQIMRKQKFKRIHFVDLFSGSGLVKINEKIMPGTPLVPLIRIKEGLTFDNYFFSDWKKEYVKSLEIRAKKIYNGNTSKLRVENYDFNTSVNHLFGGRWPDYENYHDNAYLVIVDPFGMAVSWEKLERILKSGSVDMILTFMTWGFERNRTIERSASAMTSVFGNENWRQRDDFLELYCEQIRNISKEGKLYRTTVLAVENAVGATYHLIFVSTSEEGGHNSFGWIREHIDKVDLGLLKDAFRGATEPGSDLDYYMKNN